MPARRGHGEGGLHWHTKRKRWIATASLGFDPAGRRIVKTGSGRTKTEAREKLKEVLRDYQDGLAVGPADYTVKDAVENWLVFGLDGRDENTLKACTSICRTHVLPSLGRRKLRELSAEDVERWLAEKAKTLSTRTLQGLHSCLNRSVKRAMARDKVKRNVVELVTVPQGRAGRASKSLTMRQALALLSAAEKSRLYPYIVVSLLTGARTEELRALTWANVDLVGDRKAVPVIPPHIAVLRSVRRGGDTKTRKSRRSIALPARCVEVLKRQRKQQAEERLKAGTLWREHDLVFASKVGTPMDPSHVRRDFRAAIKGAEGIDPKDWTPREMRHSFVSLLSDAGVRLEDISRLVGHSGTAVTEEVYRHQIRPVIDLGAVTMDSLFGTDRASKLSP